jgi:hypothetical protein
MRVRFTMGNPGESVGERRKRLETRQGERVGTGPDRSIFPMRSISVDWSA